MVRSESKPSDRGEARDRGMDRQELLDALPDMLFRMSRDGEYLDFKPAAGLEPYVSPNEFLGRNVADVLPRDLVQPILDGLRRAIDTRTTEILEYELDLADGSHRYEARLVPLGRDDVLAVVRDRTVESPVGRRIIGTEYRLTERELGVLRLAAAGNTDKEIGAELGISPMTVRKHIAHILRRMNATSRTEACVRAVRENILG